MHRLLFLFILAFLAGCSDPSDSSDPSDEPDPSDQSDPVVLQTDWFPQPEHGGFYQALAKGYYKEAGLDVTILPGGPNSMGVQKVLRGRAHFAMHRADAVYTLHQRDVPVVMVMATLQHDPQAILLHAQNPIDSLAELDGTSLMAIPGLPWIDWLKAYYDIDFNVIPHDFGMERFLNDPSFIMQCLLTNEPYVARQAGVEPKLLPLRESGFDPYHGIYCLRSFAAEQPDRVRRFVQASLRGWRDFINGDPQPAFDLIAERNSRMTPEFMRFSYQQLKNRQMVTGKASPQDQTGHLDPQRLTTLARRLHELGLLDGSPPADHPWFTTRFLPDQATEPNPIPTPGDEPADAPL